jgi:hypothetical protein
MRHFTFIDVLLLCLIGGAPELCPQFQYLVRASKELDKEVIDRCNLTALLEPGTSCFDFVEQEKKNFTVFHEHFRPRKNSRIPG